VSLLRSASYRLKLYSFLTICSHQQHPFFPFFVDCEADRAWIMQAEVQMAIKSIRKNAGKSVNQKFVAGNSAWVKTYAARILKLAIEQDGLEVSDNVQAAVAMVLYCSGTLQVHCMFLMILQGNNPSATCIDNKAHPTWEGGNLSKPSCSLMKWEFD
jgi:hypothetical protein